MLQNNALRVKQLFLLQLLLMILYGGSVSGQIYQHNFGTVAINTHPYTVAPNIIDSNLSGSAWTSSTNTFTSFAGASGQALAINAASGTNILTLTLNVAPNYEANLTSFDFWRQRSSAGPQNWALTINGTPAGSGTTPTSGTNVGVTPLGAAFSGLTGTVTVTLTLTGGTGGTFRIDDFTLNGAVVSTCATTVSSFLPVSGPAGTVVQITGSGFTGATAVKFGTTDAAGFTVLSNTQIQAQVPGGATSGNVSVINGCTAASVSVFTILSSTCVGTALTEVFISELYDEEMGSGGIIELYNPTANTITFGGNYVLQRYGNINDATPTAGYILVLPGSIGPGQTYQVAAIEPSNCTVTSSATISAGGFNANDKFELLKNGVVIDVVHVPFPDPGYTIIRKPDAIAPVATYNTNDWNNFSTENCATVGAHTINSVTAPTVTQPVSATACEGGSATFTVGVTPSAGFTYQWKVLNAAGVWINVTNNSNYSGATTATLTINGVPASFNNNQYYCEVTSAQCIIISNAVQLQVLPALATAVVTTVQPTCAIPTGAITVVTPTGAGLTYSLNGGVFQSGASFVGLAPGTYTVTTQNAAGCTSVTSAITINAAPAAPAVATVTTIQPTCSTPTGTLTVTAPTGAGLTYSLNGGAFQAATIFTGLTAGTYTITTQNAAGCTSVTAAITINAAPASPAVATVTTVQPTCSTPTGTITVTTPTGAGLTYSLNGGAFQSATTFTGLTAGNYTITTQNAAGCTSVTAAITINAAPAAPAVATVATVQPTCSTPTGTITVTTPTGAGLTYSLNGGAFQAATIFTGLTAGNYTITTQNAAGCTSVTAAITINAAPAAPAVATVATVQPTCSTPTGTITVTTPTGAGLTYSLNGGAFQAATIFTGLTAGNYTITTQNAAGCTSVTAAITINAAPASPAVATVATVQPTCSTPTGTITVTAPTGAGLTYSLNGGAFQSATTFTGLTAGNYTITTQNAAGCTSVTPAITISAVPAAPAVATVTTVQPTCTAPTGTITVTAPTGAGFTYSLNGGAFQAATTFTGLTAGNYTITTQNAAGCTSVTPAITINAAPAAPAVATVTTVQPTCTTPTGTITVTAPTGAGLTYSLNGGAFQSATTFTGLTAGNYTITTQNAAGCTSVTSSITINPAPAAPAVATVSTVQPTCTTPTGTLTVTAPTGAGLTYSLNGGAFQSATTFTGLTAGNYTITTQNAAGCTSVTAAITINAAPAAPAVATVTTVQPTCSTPTGTITVTAPTGAGLTYSLNGGAFQSATTFTGLTAGNYTITTQNAAGCTSVTAAITINAVPAAPAVATVTTVQPTCSTPTGTIMVTAPTGAGLTYSLNGGAFQAGTSFANLNAGDYTVTVQNTNGCTSTTGVITITTSAAPQITTVQGCEETVSGRHYIVRALPLNDSFDTENASIEWRLNSTLAGDQSTLDITQYIAHNNIMPADFPLQFEVTVSTAGGCEDSALVTVESYLCTIPKGISPNNDEYNQKFDLTGLNVKKLVIFNRYGKEVYSRENYTYEWEGQSNKNEELPTGTYYYVAELPGRTQSGWVYINRQ